MKPNSFAQKEDGWCGPAALSFALSQIGINVGQEQIVKDTGTTKSKGVDPFPLERSAQKYGAKVTVFSGGTPNGTIAKISQAIQGKASVIVDYLVKGEEDGGHYVVFLGKQGNDIKVWNPSGGKITTMRSDYFIENWIDKTEDGKLLKNWAMVIRA